MHLDDDLLIDDLSRIMIRPKSTENGFLNSKLSNNNNTGSKPNYEEDSNESIVVSVNPNDLNNQLNVSKNESNNKDDKSIQLFNNNNNQNQNVINNGLMNNDLINNDLMNNDLINNDLMNNNLMNSNLMNNNLTNSFSNNLDDYNNDSNQLSDDLIFDDKRNENAVIDVEWSDDDIAILLECCKQFIQEFTYYNISVDLAYIDPNDDELWQRIAQKVQKYTSKSYNRPQCKSKFIKLRTTYMNIIAYSAPENTYFGNLKYFQSLKQLIDGLKPSIDLLQLNGQLKARNKDRYKEQKKDKSVSSSYLALIQQVKAYSRQFSGKVVFNNKLTRFTKEILG